MSEYGDRLDEIRATYEPQAEAAWIEFLALPEPTTGDLKTLADREVAVRIEIEESIRELDAPDEIADLHDLLAGWITAMREAGEGLGVRAGTVGSWDELLQSAEYRTFETTLTGGADVCNEFQAKLDATAARGTFGDTPWMSGDLKDVADAVIGCDTIPEDLDAVFGQ
jgi:hypothetical protein